MVTEGIEPSTVALLAQRSNQLSYATFLAPLSFSPTYTPPASLLIHSSQRPTSPHWFSAFLHQDLLLHCLNVNNIKYYYV